MEAASVIPEKKEPSLLRQIIDAVDVLDEVQQHLLLLQLRKDEILAGAKAVDEKYAGMWKEMTEDEIAEMVSENRRKWYEESLRD